MAWNHWFASGSALASLGIIMGAFGSHALKARLDEYSLNVFEIGVRYQMYAAMGLLGLAFLSSKLDSSLVQVSGFMLFFGALIFSGALYTIALTGMKWFGAIAPIGGALMVLAFLLMAFCCLRN